MRPHQAFHSPTARRYAPADQDSMHPPAAVCPSTLPEHRAARGKYLPVLSSTPALFSTSPRVEATSRDPVKCVHALHLERSPLVLDEREDIGLRAEENRMAFFRSSCSCSSSA